METSNAKQNNDAVKTDLERWRGFFKGICSEPTNQIRHLDRRFGKKTKQHYGITLPKKKI